MKKSKAAGLGIEAEALFDWLPDKLKMSEREIAKRTGAPDASIRYAKKVLSDAGLIEITELGNWNRPNPSHLITKVKVKRELSSPIKHVFSSEALAEPHALPLHGLQVWGDMERLDLISAYLKSGWDIVPEFDKKPVMSRKRWYKTYPADADKLNFFAEHGNLGIGRWVWEHAVFDFDSRGAINRFDAEKYDTLMVETKRGMHLYFGYSPRLMSKTAAAEGLDIKTNGAFVSIPTSPNKIWVNLAEPMDAPEELVVFYEEQQQQAKQDIPSAERSFSRFKLPEVIVKGTRNSTLFRYGRSLRARGATFNDLKYHLWAANQNRCQPPLPDTEFFPLIRHIWTYADKEGFVHDAFGNRNNR
jgi:hypothetical protein